MSGTGTQANPIGTILAAAAAVTDKPRIYVCGGNAFIGSVTIPSGVSIYGGLSCGDWVFKTSNPHPTLNGEANSPALTITSGAAPTELRSVDVEAASASVPDASSIAVLSVDASVTIASATITSHQAGVGSNGVAPQLPASQAAPGAKGVPGCGAAADLLATGDPGTNTCGSDDVSGGGGGNGSITAMGGNGSPGGPTGMGGVAGNGQPMANCNAGTGAGGSPGMPGAVASMLGALAASGFDAAVANDALTGTSGRGGGGGGGGMKCSAANGSGKGPGGGGGGAGGCGGVGGHGGKGGGASIALAVVGGTVTLVDVALASGPGGTGGAGADGQGGQLGGDLGAKGANNSDVTSNACFGGSGGNGGQGGPGAGGNGGPSVLVATMGGTVMRDGSTSVDMKGLGGGGGVGSTNSGTVAAAPTGTNGLSCSLLDFMTSTCTP